ncbi:MAG: hypothetical protein WBP59_15355, partial [Ilumatobacteraceae bacterium]
MTSMDPITQLPSDRALVAAARNGSQESWSELRSRHETAVTAVRVAAGRRKPGRTVDEAFADLRTTLVEEETTSDGDTPRVRAIRPLAIAALTGGTYGPGDSVGTDDADLDGEAAAELSDLAAAFASLPEAWQSVLWHRWVDDTPAA